MTARRCREHEWTTRLQVSDTVVHRTCGICAAIEEDVFVAQGHTVTIAQGDFGGLVWQCTCGSFGSTGSNNARAEILQHVDGAENVVVEGGHTFRITVEIRDSHAGVAHGFQGVPNPVEVRAWSLAEAFGKAAELPLDAWFYEGEDE